MKKLFKSIMCTTVISLSAISQANAALALQGRLAATEEGTDYQAWYDPNLDITWAASANITGDGDIWSEQMAWVSGITIGGISGWRLPDMDVNNDGIVVDCNGGGVTNCADNELGYLFWEEGISSSSPGPFTNINSTGLYWSSTDYAPAPTNAWSFLFSNGYQGPAGKVNNANYAWAVYSGDVASATASAVPVPAAAWLFGSAFAGLMGIRAKKN